MFKLWFKNLSYECDGFWNSETEFIMSALEGRIDIEFARKTYVRKYPNKEIKRFCE